MTVLVIAGMVLAVLALLLPATVYFIHCETVKMRKLMERMHWQMDQMRKDVDAVKKKWGA